MAIIDGLQYANWSEKVFRQMRDGSHSAEVSTLQAIELSERPVAITHANPCRWRNSPRNKSDTVLKALAESGGMLGFSLYPHHLRGKSACSLRDFCTMVADTVELIGVDHLGFGSDLCQDQSDSVGCWMRSGRRAREPGDGEATSATEGFPEQPGCFRDNRDFRSIIDGLREVGLSPEEVETIAHGNWLRFFRESFAASGTP